VIIAVHQGVTTAAQTDLATNLITPVTSNLPPGPAASEPGHRSRMRRQVATPLGARPRRRRAAVDGPLASVSQVV
jgi:hypothetical protein